MSVEDVDMVVVQGAQHVASHDFFGPSAHRAARRKVHDPVHHWQERVDVVGRKQDPDLSVERYPAEKARCFLCAAGVEAGERFVEEQELRLGC
jgi:hypothetical protein